MDLAAIATCIEGVLSGITGIPDTSIAWVNTYGTNEWSTYPSLELVSKGPKRARAWDWTEKEYDSGSGQLVKTQVGPRELVVTIRAESIDQTPGSDATQIISNIQTRLQRDSVTDTFDAAGLAVATISDPIIADFPADDRMHSVAQIDVMFNLNEADVDTQDSGDWFNIVALSSNKLKNVSGTDYAHQMSENVGPP